MSMDDQGQPEQSTPWRGIRRWTLRVSVGALLVSLMVHVVMLVVTALLLVGGGGGTGGEGEEAPGVVEFAVMPEQEFEALAETEIQIETPAVDALLEDREVSLELSELASEPLTDSQLDVDVSSSSGGESLDVEGVSGSGGATGGAASFFGIEARGNRFAYIVDLSGSMAQDGRLDSMLEELRRSVTELGSHVSFYIVFYSDDAFPLGNRREWTDATGSGKRWAREKLTAIEALGSTHPVPAFELVSRIRPRADAIYFMTDGQFNNVEADVNTILAMNRERPTPIHCITFVTRDAEASMRRIAQETGGSYTHVGGGGRP